MLPKQDKERISKSSITEGLSCSCFRRFASRWASAERAGTSACGTLPMLSFVNHPQRESCSGGVGSCHILKVIRWDASLFGVRRNMAALRRQLSELGHVEKTARPLDAALNLNLRGRTI